MDVFLHLKRLIRRVRDDEISRKNLPELCEFLVDRPAELRNLLLIAHVDRQCDGTTALPLSGRASPRVVVEIARRALIAGNDLDQVAEINGSSGCGPGYGDTPNGISGFELPRGVDDDLSLAGLEGATRRKDVARAQYACERGRLQPILGQAFLRIFEVDHLR